MTYRRASCSRSCLSDKNQKTLPKTASRDSGDDAIVVRLKSTFGYTSFRPLQREIVQATLSGKDVFVLMPTGGGKSLCYQLPALLREGLTVVVSPLIALMKDQVDSLHALGVAATFINSSLDLAEAGRRQAAVVRGDVKILYAAPERLMLPAFLHLLSAAQVACFVIDEAHCISEWGHDFRPEYRELSKLRGLFPSATIGAFTATATSRVEADIKSQLGLAGAPSFRGSFNRSNLYYDVRPKAQAYDQLVDYLRPRQLSSGIIYCQSREGTEQLAAKLRSSGFSATAYHAGLEAGERRRRQESFIRDDTSIIVATIAFGMGIDKPDVRFVVHYDLPKSLEGYYQESGRAGRDGEKADCLLFLGYGDVAKQRYFIDKKGSASERRIALAQLRQMLDWAGGLHCRRRALLAYFGESLNEQPNPCCDVCSSPPAMEDWTIAAQMLLSCAKRTGERFGAAHLIDVLRGSRGERVLRLGHDKLSTYGIGGDRSKEEWQHLVGGLLAGGYVHNGDGGFSVLKVTEQGEGVLFQGVRVSLPKISAVKSDRPLVDQTLEPLFQRLRELRKRLADRRGVPPYTIFHDSTLRLIASEKPRNKAQLLRIHGVGERKALDFGDTFLAAIQTYTGDCDSRAEATGRHDLSPTVRETLRLFKAGRSIGEIATARDLKPTTIEEHLAAAIEAGEDLALDRLVCEERRRAIADAMAGMGTSALKPVLERLGGDYTYAELRFVRATLRRAGRGML